MTDGEFLLRAILDHPEDSLLRLAYADALEEQGECARAAFVRLPGPFRWEALGGGWLAEGEKRCQLQLARDLLRSLPDGAGAWEVRHGMPSAVTCLMAYWLEHGPALARQYPIVGVKLSNIAFYCRPDGWTFGYLGSQRRSRSREAEELIGLTPDRSPTEEAARAALSTAAIRWARATAAAVPAQPDRPA